MMHRASWTTRPAEQPVDSLNSRRAVVRLGQGTWEALLRLLHTELNDRQVVAQLAAVGARTLAQSTVHRVRQEFGVPIGRHRRHALTVQLAGFIHDDVVAAWVDCDPTDVRLWREQHKTPEYSWENILMQFKPRDRVNWRNVDLRRSTAELTAELGCSRPSISEARRRFGVTAPGVPRKSQVDWDKQGLGTVPDRVIAERIGLDVSTVRAARSARGIPAHHRVGRPTTFDIDWSAIDWEGRTDQQLAKEIGCSRTTVRRNRHRLGLPTVLSGRARLV